MKRNVLSWALIGLFVIGAGIFFTGCESGSGSDEDEIIDNPAKGIMTEATANKVYQWKEIVGGGAEIEKFLNADELKKYLDIKRQATGSAGTLVVKEINGRAVKTIRANAFKPTTPGGQDDITNVVAKISLPETLETLENNIFEGVAKTIQVDIPNTAPVIQKIVQEKVEAAKAALPETATEDEVKAAVDAALATAKTEVTQKLETAVGKGFAGVEVVTGATPTTPSDPAAPEVPLLPPTVVVEKPQVPAPTPTPNPTPNIPGIVIPTPPTPPIGDDDNEQSGGNEDDDDDDDTGGQPTPEPEPEPEPEVAPALEENFPKVEYDGEAGTVSVIFTFDKAVTATAPEGWNFTKSEDKKTITAKPTATSYGTPVTISFTAANDKDSTKVLPVGPVSVIPVEAVFERPDSGEAYYRVQSYDPVGVVSLYGISGDDPANYAVTSSPTWYYVKEEGLKKIFNAVYTPNKEGSKDEIESGKTKIDYTGEISKDVLKLFTIKVGTTANADLIIISGSALPNVGGMSAYNLLVIDVGVPGGTDNTGLNFIVPYQKLGINTNSYAGIRFRVNKGAYLELEVTAEQNAKYDKSPIEGSDFGNLTNGCVQIMSGGRLRDGAYQGYPLGNNSVILAQSGSYLAIGPANTQKNWFKGWLIGPKGVDDNGGPTITWDTDADESGGYIEVRPEKLAISANVTLNKPLGLIYSVWFVNGPILTIDVKTPNPEYPSLKGLFSNAKAEGTKFKFYGRADESGGINPDNPAATIIVKEGSFIEKRFLNKEINADMASGAIIPTSNSEVTIVNLGIDESAYGEYVSTINGFCNWGIKKGNQTEKIEPTE
jgi:hypothetical protein